MQIKGFLSLVSLLMISIVLNGQSVINIDRTNEVNATKIEIYESLIACEELNRDREYHIVTIMPISLQMMYSFGFMDAFYDIEKAQDTTSVAELRQILPDKYQIYEVNDRVTNIISGYDYISLLQRSDTIYTSHRKTADNYNPTYDIIKIYEPLDMWYSLYTSTYRGDTRNISVVIPVKYEYLNSTILVEEKYFLFKIEYDIIKADFEVVNL